jgi:hypothetical protein
MGRLLVTLLGIALVATAFAAVPQDISADDNVPENGVTLIAVDLGSTSVSDGDAAIAETALRILADSAGGETVALMPYSDEAGTEVGHSADGSELDNAVSTLLQ